MSSEIKSLVISEIVKSIREIKQEDLKKLASTVVEICRADRELCEKIVLITVTVLNSAKTALKAKKAQG